MKPKPPPRTGYLMPGDQVMHRKTREVFKVLDLAPTPPGKIQAWWVQVEGEGTHAYAENKLRRVE